MEYQLTEWHLFAAGCLVFIVTGLVCGAVRWKHMCRPFNENAGYFYPARKIVTLFYCAIILEVPFLLAPEDDAVWNYIRIFGIIYYPVCFAVLFEKYFRAIKEDSSLWKTYIAVPAILTAAMLISLASGHDGWMTSRKGLTLTGICGVALTGILILTLFWLKEEIERFHKDNFSSDDDFPYKFASNVIWGSLVWVAAMWLIFLTGNRWIKLAADIAFSFWMVELLCVILHPQRVIGKEDACDRIHKWNRKEMLSLMTQSPDEKETACNPHDEDMLEAVKGIVNAIISRRYLEPHLLKSDILDEISSERAVLASRYISQIGYYNMVNMFRLRHAELYQAAHPEASDVEIAAASGFTSPSAYSKAARSIRELDMNLVKDVKL